MKKSEFEEIYVVQYSSKSSPERVCTIFYEPEEIYPNTLEDIVKKMKKDTYFINVKGFIFVGKKVPLK